MFKKPVIVILIACCQLLTPNRTKGGQKQPARIKCQTVNNAFAYNVYTGISPAKLYNCTMVYTTNEYDFKAMDNGKPLLFPDRSDQ